MFVAALLSLVKGLPDRALPRVQIDLDLPAGNRWTKVATTFNASIHSSLAAILRNKEFAAGIEVAEALISRDEAAVRSWYPGDQYDELVGIARVTGLSPWLLAAVDTVYDETAGKSLGFHACTSIVADGVDATGKSTVHHGRNLDYPLRAEMANITALVDFVKGGEVLYTAVTYIVMPGFNTALRPHAFSVTQDERDRGSIALNWEKLFLERTVSSMAMIRDVVHNAAGFADVVQRFSTVELAADSYFIVGGVHPGEGAVITRNRSAAEADIWKIGGADAPWYVLETNYDVRAPPPAPAQQRGG